ncbi:hypothetical protein PRIPAC_89260 [Pristionchus pacificus]|uniref:Uncharacterized protein n=1 Tax=Pristionchus pacificus TaxID=54126 RepID=A0A2A6CVK5_PRIPA|nr:hypothetical protein PRIPAC_89260 [Pristionchus pacificus]|eukprot:PDM82106.1 protein kinase [Pristionchus pacificus]
MSGQAIELQGTIAEKLPDSDTRYCIDVLKANYFNNTFIRYSVGDEDSPQLFGISCRGKGGKKYAHRICDDPDKNEVLIELSDEELKGLHLSAICRGNVIYTKYNDSSNDERLSILNRRNHTLTLGVFNTNRLTSYSNESSPIILFAYGRKIDAFDIENMRVLRSLKIQENYYISSIVGVFQEQITLRVENLDDSNYYLMTVDLPQGYYRETSIKTQVVETLTEYEFDHMADAIELQLSNTSESIYRECAWTEYPLERIDDMIATIRKFRESLNRIHLSMLSLFEKCGATAPILLKEDRTSKKIIVTARCDYKQPFFPESVKAGDQVILLENSDPKRWKIQFSTGNQATVPMWIFFPSTLSISSFHVSQSITRLQHQFDKLYRSNEHAGQIHMIDATNCCLFTILNEGMSILRLTLPSDDETLLKLSEQMLQTIAFILAAYERNAIHSLPIASGGEGDEYVSKFSSEFSVTSIKGEGGFGCVFETFNKLDNWIYAVKRVAVNQDQMERALREVRALAQLTHAGIVHYNASWIEQPPEGWQRAADGAMLKEMGLPRNHLKSAMNYRDDCVFIYIQMQLCNYSLSDWLKNNVESNSRKLPRMKRWFKQMAEAVEYIHRNNLIHRDLKPSNVLFLENDLLKLCDLGIATHRHNEDESASTMSRTNLGTMLYMSPEQRFNKPYSSKTDVFSLGLILAELVVVMASARRTEANFINLLTQADPRNRPTSRDLLCHFNERTQIPIKPNEIMDSFHNEPSPFIYFVIGLILYTFNTATLEFLPALQVVGNQSQSRIRIAGVCNGVITVQTNNCCIATARLPRGYIDGHSSKQTSELQTSTVAFDELFDQCSCSICFETFDSIKCIPRVLDCGHTFCEVCLLNEKLCPKNQIKCPNCSKIHKVSNKKELPINYFAISIAEQTMKSRIDSRVVCTSCSQQCSSSSVRMCMKSDCTMFEKLICLTCVVDDNHGGHVVKYDVKLEKIRGELREKVSNLQTKVEEKQQNVLKKAEQLGTMIEAVKTNFTKIAIPTSIIGQLETLASAQDAIDYEEIVKDLSETIINQCETLTWAFDRTLNATKGLELFDDNTEHKETIDGTIFHWNFVSPHRLYVKSKGIEFDAELPDDDLLCNGVHANAIYFSSSQKIYRAVYTLNNGIEFDFMRLKQEDEGWHEGSIYSTEREGRTHIVRMFDVSDSDGIPFDVTDETLIEPKLMCVHSGLSIYYIVGSHKGVLTIVGVRDGECYLMTGNLPKDYVSSRSLRFDSSLSVVTELPDTAPTNGKSSTLTAMNQVNEIDEYMRKTIAELRKRNSELKKENELLKTVHEADKRELNSIINELRTKNAQLEQEYNRLQKNNNEENDEPCNILFVENDVLKLCDLRISSHRRNEDGTISNISRSNQEGTLLYMSTEQVAMFPFSRNDAVFQRDNKPYSSKTDVFSLGLILTELVAVLTTSQRNQKSNVGDLLPDGDLLCTGAHYNAIFLLMEDLKFTISEQLPPNTTIRQLEDGMWRIIFHQIRTVVYWSYAPRHKLFAKVNGKMIFADLPGDLQNAWPTGKALLVRVNNKIPIKPKESMYSFHNEPSPFIYFAIGLILYAFNTATLEFLPALQMVGNQIQSRIEIAGVCNGVITVRIEQNENSCLATAQLSRGYFLSTEPSQKEETPVLSEKIDGHSSKQTSELQTSTVAFDELFDQCSCSICFETFDSIKCKPRVLDCGHTFCEVCLLNEKLGPSNQIKCPNCSKIHKLSNEKELPINYFAINIAEQTMKSRIDSRVVCTSCSQQCSSSSVRMCMKSDCTMFEKLICLTCVVDDNHGGHVVKYDVKLEKIRGELREKVSNLQTKVEEKQQNVLKKAEQLGTMIEAVKTNFTKIAIPTSIIGQLEKLASAQDAIDYEEIVKDLSETIINQCETLTGAFDHTLNAAKGLELFDDNTEHKETIDVEEIENQSSSEQYFIGISSCPIACMGIEFDAELPDDDLLCNGVHANAIYFSSSQKIYRAVYTLNNGIEFDFMRLKQEDEGWHEGSIYSTERDGRTHIVRMFDVSDSDGIPFDVTDETLIEPKLMCVHREKAIYVSEEPGTSQPSMHAMSETVIRVDLPCNTETASHYSLHARDSSAFLYISNQLFLYVFNMESIGLSIYYIVGAHKGVLTIVGVRDGECYLMTGNLPKDYVSSRSLRFDSSLSVVAELPDTAPTNGKSSTLTAMNQVNEIDEYMRKTIAELRKRNSELKKENELLKTVHEADKREWFRMMVSSKYVPLNISSRDEKLRDLIYQLSESAELTVEWMSKKEMDWTNVSLETDTRIIKEETKNKTGNVVKAENESDVNEDLSIRSDSRIIQKASRKFQCELCSKILKTKETLKTHMRCHIDDEKIKKPFMCEQCGKRFTANSHLKKHRNTHLSTEDPQKITFECDKCDKKYHWKEALVRHKRSHLADDDPIKRKYQCKICGKRTTDKPGLRRHMFTHNAKSPPTMLSNRPVIFFISSFLRFECVPSLLALSKHKNLRLISQMTKN